MLTRRSANGIGVLGVTGLMFGALIFEHVLKLAPCNMCMLQRGATLCLGAVFLLAFVHDPGRLIARAYALLVEPSRKSADNRLSLHEIATCLGIKQAC